MSQPSANEQPKTDHLGNLDPKDLALAEFNYIANCIFQANEDRARVSSYYFVTAAAVVAAILGSNLKDGSAWLYLGFTLLFGLLSLIGYFTVLQLARLRIAWRSGADAMNQVIQYYVDHSTDKTVEERLIWFKRNTTLDNCGRVESVSFLLALSVIVTDFGTTVVSFVYAGQTLFAIAEDQVISIPWWATLISIGAGLIPGSLFTRFQIREYFAWVHKSSADELPSFLERFLKRIGLGQPIDT